MKKKRLRKRIVMDLILMDLIVLILLLSILYRGLKVTIIDHYIKDDELYLVFQDKVFWSLDNIVWAETDENNTVAIPVSADPSGLRIKNRFGYTYGNYSLLDPYLSDASSATASVIYIAVGANESIFNYLDSANKDEASFLSLDESICKVEQDGTIKGLENGQTSLRATVSNKTYMFDVTVTDLIDPLGSEFNYEKDFITPDLYTREDNDLLDAILVSRIEKAGYQSRAAVLATAWFLALEFPYRIHYFDENGRIDSYTDRYSDGEGRYYHIGLYLDESRYENLDQKLIRDTPAVWGGILVEYSNDRIWPNGLDCSGFVSWCLLQAGYDPGDLGAGIAEWDDLSDLGPKSWLASSLSEIKAGDLLVGGDDPVEGGHIAILAGLKDGYFYVAESQGTSEYYWGYCIRKYSAEELLQYFFYRVDMAEYYGKDGNYKEYWLSE